MSQVIRILEAANRYNAANNLGEWEDVDEVGVRAAALHDFEEALNAVIDERIRALLRP